MDLGKKSGGDPGVVRYSSEVKDTSRTTIEKFNERVRRWAERADIKLGEGTFSILPRGQSMDLGGYVLYLAAPLADGDWESIEPDLSYPMDESCIESGKFYPDPQSD